MKKLRKIVGWIVAAYFAFLILSLAYTYISFRVKTRITPGTILEVNFEQEFAEAPSEIPLSVLAEGRKPTLLGVLKALDRASRDPRVWGVVARVGESTNLGLAQIEEIRDAIASLRKSGKKAIAWSESFGEFAQGNRSYYLATAFDEIYLIPTGDLGLTGFLYGSPFVAGTLEKLGIEPLFDHREEYKDAMNTFTEKKFTQAHREATESLMMSHFSRVVKAIAQARGMEEGKVREIMDSAPYTAKEALEIGLVDGLLYQDEVVESAKKRAGKEAKTMGLAAYLARAGDPWKGRKAVALVYGIGPIMRGKSGFDPLLSSYTMGSDTISAALRDAVLDGDVRAIVFRIDSPGGSAVASDIILREVVRAQNAGKPVIVSMGNVAASGGYWVSMRATKIVAEPSTITGSIGVFAGKFYTKAFWEKLGVTWDTVQTSRRSAMWSGISPYTQDEWKRFEEWLDGVYDDFLEGVAKGRGMPKERVREVARGRVWTGEQALGLGLVDELGGIRDAVALAKKEAGIPEEEAVRVVEYPKRKTLLELILEGYMGEETIDTRSLGAALGKLTPLLRTLALATRSPGDTALIMKEWLVGW
jgi:protease-4